MFHSFDVTDQTSCYQGAKFVEREFGKLDILINNAGIASDGPPGTRERRPPSQVPISEVKTIYETNVFGVIGTIQAFLPLLRQAPAGRIVNVSSGLGILNSDRKYLLVRRPSWFFPRAIRMSRHSASTSNSCQVI